MSVGIDQIDGFLWNDVYYDDDLTTGANDGSSEADAWQSWAAMDAAVKPGDRVNMKRTASPVVLSGYHYFRPGTISLPIWYRGYETIIGDQGRWQASINLTFICDVGPQLMSDLELTSTAYRTVYAVDDHQTTFLRCKIDTATSYPAAIVEEAVFIACEIANTGTFSSSGYNAWDGDGIAIGCLFQADGNVILSDLADESVKLMLFACEVISNSAETRDGLSLAMSLDEGSYAAVQESIFYGAVNGINITDINAAK